MLNNNASKTHIKDKPAMNQIMPMNTRGGNQNDIEFNHDSFNKRQIMNNSDFHDNLNKNDDAIQDNKTPDLDYNDIGFGDQAIMKNCSSQSNGILISKDQDKPYKFEVEDPDHKEEFNDKDATGDTPDKNIEVDLGIEQQHNVSKPNSILDVSDHTCTENDKKHIEKKKEKEESMENVTIKNKSGLIADRVITEDNDMGETKIKHKVSKPNSKLDVSDHTCNENGKKPIEKKKDNEKKKKEDVLMKHKSGHNSDRIMAENRDMRETERDNDNYDDRSEMTMHETKSNQ